MTVPICWSGEFSPPLRGGEAARDQKKPRSILGSRRRGGVQPQQNSVEFAHHPVRSIRRLRDILLRSRPPLLGEEGKIANLCVGATAPRTGYDLSDLRYLPRCSHPF